MGGDLTIKMNKACAVRYTGLGRYFFDFLRYLMIFLKEGVELFGGGVK